MAAYQDKDQAVKFYFGNAMRDLAAILPKDDAVSPQHGATQLSQVESVLAGVEASMERLQGAQRELSFLVQDLGRMIKRV